MMRDDVDLLAYNTFGIAARAAHWVDVHHADDARDAVRAFPAAQRLILGGGSNIVLTHDWPGVVLHLASRGCALEGTDANTHFVRVAAGEPWDDVVRWTLARGLGGLENLSLIPGTAGAAPIQNIGAYGLELADRLASVEVLDLDSGVSTHWSREACALAYRDSVFKRHPPGRSMVMSLQLALPRRWTPLLSYRELAQALADTRVDDPMVIRQAVVALRTRKLPDWRVLGNAGSFFKNPTVLPAQHSALRAQWPDLVSFEQPDGRYKLAAGWLIDRAGWKGRTMGQAGVHDQQALVLVNRGGATGADILALASAITADIRARFGVTLEREPVVY